MSNILSPLYLDFIRLELNIIKKPVWNSPNYFGNIKEPILKMPHELRKEILTPTLFPRNLLNM